MVETNINNNNKKILLIKIRSKHILNKIFDNLQQNKTLKLIKYNKNLQSKLNKDINDYKGFLKIVIDIIPKEFIWDKFINTNGYNKSYYHIYFNDDKEEIKRYTIFPNDKITKIKIIIDYEVKSLSELFSECKSIKKIKFNRFNRSDFKNMSKMFYKCTSLEELNILNFNTNNVIDMSYMFYGRSSLKELNLSNFNTNNVKYMSLMFYNCYSLEKINISNFNTIEVENMDWMFANCYKLKELNLDKFNTNNVIDMSCMFYKCKSLEELNLSNFRIVSCRNMDFMLYKCSSLKKLICSDELLKKIQ